MDTTTTNAVDRIFDLIVEGLPRLAILEVKWAIEDAAQDGTTEGDPLALQAMAESLAAWSKWTDDGADRKFSDLPEGYLEGVTFEASARGVEAWREMAIRWSLERDPVTKAALAKADAVMAMLDRTLGEGAVSIAPAAEEVG